MSPPNIEISTGYFWFQEGGQARAKKWPRENTVGFHAEACSKDWIWKGETVQIILMFGRAYHCRCYRRSSSREKRKPHIDAWRLLPKVRNHALLLLTTLTRYIGGCEVDKSYTGPKLDSLEGGKFGITAEFIKSMIQWFKDGKALPRRYVWEIVLGAHTHFAAEESLVKLDLEDGMTVDVIGDVHGIYPA